MQLKKTIIIVVSLIFMSCSTLHHRLMTPEEKHNGFESFEFVWSTIRDKHWETPVHSADWDSIKTIYASRVMNAETREAVRAALVDLISELGKSHYSIIPKEVYANMELQTGHLANGELGIMPVILDGRAYVRKVNHGSPAEKCGIKAGWEILSIYSEHIPTTLAQVSREFANKSWHDGVMMALVESRLYGKVGASIKIKFRRKNQVIKKKLICAEKRGYPYQWGYIPEMYVWTEIDTIGDNIGYIAFNMFLDPIHLVPTLNKAMLNFQDMHGLIFDLRGNEGGMAEICMGLAGWLVDDKNYYFGQMITQSDTLKLVVNPRPVNFKGKVAVLVDQGSASASEFFAGGLQDIGRAKIFGSKTAGAALPSQIELLKNGNAFQYAIANYITTKGEALEGCGVIPNVEIKHTRETLLAGRDVVLEAALEWMQTQITKR
ncbi:hypothetical protein EH223_16140 [candidate division KSB1 bacterium]|nr:hypothetical protein [candidate division KSB1 bacterium]RQW01057.1 MAG: hypothetical protein EH223_16140 [candidate division KSB1 bacterium]